MPVEAKVDHERRLVRGSFTGTVSPDDMRSYLKATWAGGGLDGYGELVDVRAVDPGTLTASDLLALSQEALGIVFVSRPARLAMVVSSDEQAQKAEFYGAARGSLRAHAEDFRAFYSLEEAEAWLTGSG